MTISIVIMQVSGLELFYANKVFNVFLAGHLPGVFFYPINLIVALPLNEKKTKKKTVVSC